MESKTDNISIETVLPSIKSGMGATGFFFGAGTSVEAGFPTLKQLTKSVFDSLSKADADAIEGVLEMNGLTTPNSQGSPNIEEIADCIQDHLMQMRVGAEKQAIEHAEDSLRSSIVKILSEINEPDLTNHIRFFESIKAFLATRHQNIWIFTTNYDRCLEVAASLAGVNLIDGFLGTTTRFFAPHSFRANLAIPDAERSGHATFWKAPTIKLVKLHGSLDWWTNGQRTYASQNNDCLQREFSQSLVMPKKKKQSETLDHPYNELFDIATSVLGTECKYLVSCGYRFADGHINRRLLLPKLTSNNLKICALLSQQDSSMSEFNVHPNFNILTPNNSVIEGKQNNLTSKSWKFSELVNEIARYTGN